MKKDLILLAHLTAKSIVLVLFIPLIFSSCNSSHENRETGTSTRSELDLLTENAWKNSGDWVQRVTLSPKGIVRNVIWGVPIDSLNEKLDLAENQPANGKSYTLYFDQSDLNFTDITYIKDRQGKLSEIDFDIFVETKPQVNDLKEKLTTYLKVKFGASKINGKKIIWEKDKNTQVVLDDVSTAKDPGIKLVFLKIN